MSRVWVILVCLLWGCGSVLADTTAVDKGKQLYLSYGCALCHGKDGDGFGINSLNFKPPPTNFHNTKAYAHGLDRDSIRRSIQYGIKEDNSIMPAFEDIPQDEIDQIINYLQSLQKNSH